MAQFELKTINAGGFATRYLEAGSPDRPTLVLLHDGGFGTTAELCWAGVVDRMAAEFHIVAPELLGWGGTDKVVFFDRSPYAGRIPHIAAFLRELRIEGAFFAGASFGGSLMMRAAVAAGNPWRIKRGVSISGTGGPFRLQSGIDALSDYVPSLKAAERLTSLIVRDMSGLDEHVRQRHENSLIPGHWESLSAPRLHNPAVDRPRPQDPYMSDLASLSIPILLIEGRHDALLERGWAKRLAAASPQIAVAEMDAGHEPNIEAPEHLCPLLESFFSQA